MVEPGTHALAEPVKKRWPKVVLIIVAMIVVLVLAVVGVIAVTANQLREEAEKVITFLPPEEVFPPDDETRPEPIVSDAQTFLILGSDTRANIDYDDADADQDGRSDTMMVVRIPADRKDVYVMSIMRDSWVNIPGHGEAKINAAMAFGGVPLAVQTVEGLLDTRIDHVVIMDFEGFKGMTDALGGVKVKNPIAFQSKAIEKTYTFDEGIIDLSGAEALAFVRERMSFLTSDYQRVKNQQLFFKSLMAKLLNAGTLTDVNKLKAVIAATGPYMAVDKSLDTGYMLGLLPGLASVRASDVTFFTFPTVGTGSSSDGQSIVVVDQERLADLAPAFKNDTLAEYVATHDMSQAR